MPVADYNCRLHNAGDPFTVLLKLMLSIAEQPLLVFCCGMHCVCVCVWSLAARPSLELWEEAVEKS